MSLIKGKLPGMICNMRCLEVSDQNTEISDVNLFTSLLTFLLKHKRAMEYRLSDLRASKATFATDSDVHLAQDNRPAAKPTRSGVVCYST